MLVLMQGIPGSGKSTQARLLQETIPTRRKIISTDDFHFTEAGEYQFDPLNLSYYHAWSQWLAEYYLSQDYTVIVDNCNILYAHVEPYVKLAEKYGHWVKVFRCTGEYKSLHGVPQEIIDRMKAQMEFLL